MSHLFHLQIPISALHASEFPCYYQPAVTFSSPLREIVGLSAPFL